jgi:linoleate 8R-lipoxygenase / 9,12-octadecadienoate 8-hydroperoxide 8R-isomerase
MLTTASSVIPSRADFVSALTQIGNAINASFRPVPTQTGDYTSLSHGEAKSSVLSEVKYLSVRNVQTLKDMLVEGLEGGFVDDRTYIMERVIQLAAELPLDSRSGTSLTNGFLTKLWDDLGHPPISSLAPEFKYRSADGSNNNPWNPQLGVAGSPYARTVRSETMQPIALPDPGVVFDSVMARRTFAPHPNKISSVLFYLASIIIHDLFKTSHKDHTSTSTSSYLDLAPLYGSNHEDQELMRTFNDGKIKPDTFSERRIHGFPPGVGVLLIMFNRFHNYTVEQLALINENGRFTKPAGPSKTAPYAKYDEDLFQTGRLITCGLYVNIILKVRKSNREEKFSSPFQDYVRTILNLNRTQSLWTLDPRSKNGKNLFSGGAAEAIGNQVSAEFNLVYRWHSCISRRDEKWSQGLSDQLFPGKASADVTTDEFIKVMSDWDKKLPLDPIARPFANLQRSSQGRFSDDDLAAIFTESVEDCAGAFGANHVPIVLRAVEILGIKQARTWNLATLNEFRRHFKLAPHRTFEEINPDPLVAEQLRRLYDHPDFVELYPGITVEEAKEPRLPGSGLCTNFTTSRAILSDAVALVRGDRFYTIDYTPRHLTNWGYSLVNYDLGIDYGCVFYKLVLRALPHNFPQDSVYAHYPLVLPAENHDILTQLGRVDDYSFDKPVPIPTSISISSYAACKLVLNNKIDFQVVWGEAIEFLMRNRVPGKSHGTDYTVSGDGSANASSRSLMEPAVYRAHWEHVVKRFYERITMQLLHRNAYTIAGQNQVDIVRDVSNLAQVHFASTVFSLPLKTEMNPRGLFTETELYLLMATVFASVFNDVDPAKPFPLRHAARNVAQKLGKLMESKVRFVEKTGFLQNILEKFYRHDTLSDYGVHLIRRLLRSGKSPEELVCTHILPTAGAMVANQSQLFSQCLDYYLSEEGSVHLPEINRLSKANTAEADDILLH